MALAGDSVWDKAVRFGPETDRKRTGFRPGMDRNGPEETGRYGPEPPPRRDFRFPAGRAHDWVPAMDTPPPPKFGPNGSVLNGPEMTDTLREQYEGTPDPARPRRANWRWQLTAALVCLIILVLVWPKG